MLNSQEEFLLRFVSRSLFRARVTTVADFHLENGGRS